MAAGAFAMLKDNSPVWFATTNSPDLTVPAAASLELLMLAQAQECFLLKAIAGLSQPPFFLFFFFFSAQEIIHWISLHLRPKVTRDPI